MEENFQEIKEEILRRGLEANACDEIDRASESDNLAELAQVIKDNFNWCVSKRVINSEIIGKYKAEFASVGIYANESRDDGYVVIDNDVEYLSGDAIAILCDNATVNRVYDNATVNEVSDNATINEVYGNSTVKYVSGNATVNRVSGNATVNEVSGNATVNEVSDNAYISVYNYIECKINDHAIMRVRSENKIYTNTPNRLV